MGRAKDIVLKVIPAKIANDFIKQNHYSGKVVNNSSLHFGAFLDGVLGGVMSYGSPLDKRKVLPLVHTAEGVEVLWNEMLELNRMAFSDILPRNSESRCIAISFKLIKKNAPHIKWVLSFSDGTQCGDGTIYRASGFQLTSIKANDQIWEAPDGTKISRLVATNNNKGSGREALLSYAKKFGDIGATNKASMTPFIKVGYSALIGFQMRYIYLLDKTCKITVPVLPFSEIEKQGAGMYKGEKRNTQAGEAQEKCSD